MKQLVGKITTGILFLSVLMLCLSIGMLVASEAKAANPAPVVRGALMRVDQEQKQLVIKPDGVTELVLQWNKESVFLLNNESVSVEVFAKNAMNGFVDVTLVPQSKSQQEGIKVIQKCAFVQTVF